MSSRRHGPVDPGTERQQTTYGGDKHARYGPSSGRSCRGAGTSEWLLSDAVEGKSFRAMRGAYFTFVHHLTQVGDDSQARWRRGG